MITPDPSHVRLKGALGGIDMAEVTSVEWAVSEGEALDVPRLITRHGDYYSFVDLTFKMQRMQVISTRARDI